MKAAGIDTTKFKPHSIRHASASALIANGGTLDQVMALGRWQSLTTFFKYYLKQRSTPNVTEMLVNGNSQNSRNSQNSENADEVLGALEGSEAQQYTVEEEGLGKLMEPFQGKMVTCRVLPGHVEHFILLSCVPLVSKLFWKNPKD